MTNIGISVQEGVASGVTPFIEVSKHNIGLLMERERGIPNLAVPVTSLQQDRLKFGGVQADKYGAYVSRHIFNNAGSFGAIVYGVRILGATSMAASGLFTDGAPSDQTLTKTNVTPSGPGTSAVDNFTPANVSTGDQFKVTSGADVLTYTALAGDGVAEVVLGLKALIDAQVTAANAAWTIATWTLGAGNAFIQSTMVAVNTPNPVTASTVNGSATTLATIYAGQGGQQDPGTWGNNLVCKAYPMNDPAGRKGLFLLEVYYKGKLAESWAASTWAGVIASVNEFSNYITMQAGSTTAVIESIQTITLAGGTYVAPVEADFIGDVTAVTGLHALDGVDVQLIANSEFHTTTMAQAALTYVLTRKDCMYVANLPYLATSTTVGSFATALQTASVDASYIAGYNCWVKTSDENNNFIWTPSIGCVLGAGYIRVPNLYSDKIYMPPAGVDATFNDVVDITPNPISTATLNDYTRNQTVNSVVFKKGKGFYIATSRTYSTDPNFMSVHIRRQTNFYVKTLKDNLDWAAQKPNTPDLKRQMMVSVITFFRQEYNDGGLEKTVDFDTACQVISDKSNNPPTQDRKLLNIDIQWIPTECAEAIQINLNRNDGILIAQSVS